jgi:TolB-like protein/Flp pilus assembly protein TadD
MTIWSAEIKELESLFTSITGRFPELEKDLEHLIKTDDENVALLYSRRCLEIIVTDLCQSELKRPRKTEPLKGIIDKLNREEKVPAHIITSMDHLNSLSTFGTHPKEFDPEQVKPVLTNLAIIIKWYLKFKEIQIISQVTPEVPKYESKESVDVTEGIHKTKNRLIFLFSGLFLVMVIIVVALFVFNVIGGKKQTEDVEKSVAVLPFVNLSNDPEQEYFSDGMVDEILDNLFKIGELKVISRTSSMRYKNTDLSLKEIASELGVSAILEGSVRKIGNNVRITTQLIDTKTDTHLWSEIYEGDLSDVFSIQSEVAQSVARELKTTLTSEEADLIQKAPPTTNQLAYDFYLKGNDYLSKRETSFAADMYSKAIMEDSLYTAAYARRAQAYILIYWYKFEGWQGHDIKGRKDIMKGLQINPESPEIRFAEAVACYQLDRNYDKSLKILRELKEETPNMAELYAWSSFILRRQGKWEESVNEMNRALRMDPFNADYIENQINSYRLMHQYDNQIKCSRQGLSLVPDYQVFNHYIFSGYLYKTGDLEVALRESGLKDEDIQYEIYYYNRQYNKVIEFITKYTLIEMDQHYYQPKTYQIALIHYLNGNTSLSKIYADSAITHLKEKITENPNDERYYATLGKCYAFCGDDKQAIVCGMKAIDLKPVSLDASQGIGKEQDLMEIYMFTGNYDLALDKIKYLLSVPSNLSAGELLINPVYDNLRSLPRFQKIINSAKN